MVFIKGSPFCWGVHHKPDPKTSPANPAAPPGMRDVTPRNNEPGMTTGAAPARPSTTSPSPSTDMNKTTPPPADTPASKQ